jgi:hypothetical protein
VHTAWSGKFIGEFVGSADAVDPAARAAAATEASTTAVRFTSFRIIERLLSDGTGGSRAAKQRARADSVEHPRPHAHPCDALALNEIRQREPSSLTIEVSLSFAPQDAKLLIHARDNKPLEGR